MRDSIHFQGDYTLSVAIQGRIDHYRILRRDGQLEVDGGDCSFPTLIDLVQVVRECRVMLPACSVASVCECYELHAEPVFSIGIEVASWCVPFFANFLSRFKTELQNLTLELKVSPMSGFSGL